MRYILLILCFLLTGSLAAQNHDWPLWRFDGNRSASTPEILPEKLYLQWQATWSPRIPVWDDPLNENLMQFDRIFEPIVAGGKLFLGFNDQDKVVALDLATGREMWHFYADGPVRLPLAAWGGNIYFTGDDGYCYCLNAGSGKLAWKIRLAPTDNKLLGNKRMISMWPARGGIVIRDNILYTAASIFPLMGTFIYAIDAATGKIIWKNDGTASNYILQPHRSPAFADVAPQGCFIISGDKLLVAGGRTVPAAFDLKTGEELYYKLAESGKTGGAFTCANDQVYFNHHRERMTYMYNSENGDKLAANAGEYPVVDGNNIYFSGKKLSSFTLTDDKKLVQNWVSDIPACNDLIKAGNTLYAADSAGFITAAKLTGKEYGLLWKLNAGKPVERLVAASGKLVAVTADGTVMVFGGTPPEKMVSYAKNNSTVTGDREAASSILETTGIKEGYAAVYGSDPELLKGLVALSDLKLVVLEKDSRKINQMREYFDNFSVPSERVSFLNMSPGNSFLPQYFASLSIILDESFLNRLHTETIRMLYEPVRPYGGKIWLKTNAGNRKKIASAFRSLNFGELAIQEGNECLVITKEGALAGAADWTHNYGDISNTVKSDDKTVKAPLGILWFGGNSNLDVLPRHGHGPSEQVIDGRLIIQGVNSLSARDVYTGRLLWKKVFEGLKEDTWMVYYDETYDEDNPLDPKYNQVHIPGANARGTNFIATPEYVYAIEGNRCHLLDISTGKEVKTFTSGDADTHKFAYIGVSSEYLILGNNFSDYPEVVPAADEKSSPKFESFDLTASRELLIMNRFTGQKIWNLRANHGFIHNSVIVGDGVLFCLDKLPQLLETRLRRRGESLPGGSRLLYIDLATGKIMHEETNNVFGTWLGYSEGYKLLLQATRPSRDMLNGEDGKRMIVYKTGSKEVLWDKEIKYANPPVIANDKIYTNGEGFSLLTGEPLTDRDPITGEEKKWDFKREYGCGYVVASEHLLTFRSASAAFVNLDAFEGTASLGGFKAGCSANLIVANGVLNSPDYTRTCQCPYQNQTSLAFVNMPWMNYWTNSNYKWSGKPIQSLGINLNAPGDRTSDNGVLWMEYPAVGGASPDIPVKMDTTGYFTIRKDPVSLKSFTLPWVAASAIGGIRSLEINLSKEEPEQEATYRVSLLFSEPEQKRAGERVFGIALQGKKVQDRFDIVKEAGQPDTGVMKTFAGIKAGKTLRIDLLPVKGNTILSGIEIIREN